MRRATLGLLAAAVVLALPAAAAAQAPARPPMAAPEAPPVPERDGLVLGASLGGGSAKLECGLFCEVFADERYEVGSLQLHAGGMIARELAILFDLWVTSYEVDEQRRVNHNMGSIALRWFATRRIWLEGAIGWSNFSLACTDDGVDPNCGDESKTGGAGFVAFGVEVYQSRHFVFDVSLRAGGGNYENGRIDLGALQLGVNWY